VTGPPPDRLLHLGNVVIDVVLDVPELPERGGDMLATATQTTAGGGFNVLAAAARQGLRSAYAGALGTGPFADRALAALAAERIEVLQPRKTGIDTGFVVSIVDAGGERTFVTSPGAEATLTAGDLAAVRATARDAVYLSGYSLMHPSNRAALLGWLPGLPDASLLVFDPGPLADRIPATALDAVLRRADWLTGNEREAGLLAGAADPAAAAAALVQRRTPPGAAGAPRPAGAAVPAGRGGVLVRTGADGCLLAIPGRPGTVHVPGFPVHAVDTNGAGDTHAGVFIAALAAGADPARAARLANAAAAVSVARPGPATAPTAAELARFLAGA
jgi:sugar/nucleoside kinase (ribokinase family)